jgi:cytochrome P450
LSGTTYLLAKNKSALAKTYEELRRNFDSEDDINIVSVQKLDYMFAVMHESLRIYPPVPSAIPRKAPAQGSVICGQYVPPNV